ncbi:Alpha/Beta hydrolase protein [Penicillium hordei]|uniref:Alpha/Beta hydrolase protein n=1 Tax=Penicillium hordei TaxID=40994 RepID=A0AAD6DVL4_9EURO|nr:Alpha/Beta hydrolase protein [Penicillium hordei]KAJ5593274.1 Alpha/Beta hydrolase protein [Penicillium hordei]
MGAASPPKATFPLPPYESEITAFEDTQRRPLPASFEELLALRSEEPPTDETIANDPDLTIEDLKSPSRME